MVVVNTGKKRRGRKKKCKSGFNKKNPLRVFTAFSGYDSQCMALNTLKEDTDFDFDLVGWSEIDKNAITAHDALFPQWKDRNYGDISQIDWNKVPDFDLFTYSSPCFVAGTKVLVKQSEFAEFASYVPIEDVQVGWYAMTHEGRYRKVLQVMKNPYRGLLYTITSYCYDEVTCTPDHPFYVRRSHATHDTEFEWKSAKDIDILNDEVMCFSRDKWSGQHFDSHVGFEKIEITKTDREIDVYNLEVDEDHSYVAECFVVHNCTDFSKAGMQKGGEEGSGTRSSLLWECRNAIVTKRPKYLLFENVKMLVANKFIHLFHRWVKELESYGYVNFYQVLNAKDYGVPQSRERIFMVSILKDELNQNPYFKFPEKMKLDVTPEDMCEENVDDRFYFSEEKCKEYLTGFHKKYPTDKTFDFEQNEGLW